VEADAVIHRLGLVPLPREGGWFRETWRSPERVATPAGERSRSTAILYLLAPEAHSALHRLRFDEVWHWHLGDPVEMAILPAAGAAERVLLGPGIGDGMRVQQRVPAGAWQGARLVPGGRWALLGTTMSPGFDSADFELAGPGAAASAPADLVPLLRALAPRP